MLGRYFCERFLDAARRGQARQLRARRGQIGFGSRQQLGGRAPGVQDVVALELVVVLADAPVAGFGRQRGCQVVVELAQGLQGGRSCRGVGGLRSLRCRLTQCLVDELDVAVVLLARHAVPDLGRVDEV